MERRAVLFDLDGTLVDTLGDITDATNRVLGELGFPQRTEDEVQTMVGEGVRVLLERALPTAGRERVDGAVERFRAVYMENLVRRSHPYDGIPALLGDLAARGVPMAVLSNKPDAPTRRMVEALFRGVPFAAVAGQRDGIPRKPDPAAALELAQAMSMPAARCLFVGDTRIDMETGTRAGMTPVGVAWGYRSRAELVASGATTILAAPAELLELL